MLKKFVFGLIFIGIKLSAMNMNRGPIIETGFEHKTGSPCFFTSLVNPALTYRNILLSETLPLANRVPLIGHYQNAGTYKSGKTVGEFYNPRVRIALIEPTPDILARVAPESVIAALHQAGVHDLSRVEFYINILGDFVIPAEAPIGTDKNSCNAAFHPVLIRWRGSGAKHFNTTGEEIKLFAGIFNTYGVGPKKGGIAFNKLGALGVNYHGAFSPDNGRFNYNPAWGIATFWLVGVYKNHAIVIFNIMALNSVVEELLLDITQQPDIDGLLRVIYQTVSALAPGDAATLARAADIIERSLGKTVSDQAGPSVLPIESVPALGGVAMEESPRELARRAAFARAAAAESEPISEFHTTAEPAAVEPSEADQLAQVFMDYVAHAKISEALSILEIIENIDPEKAMLCRLTLREFEDDGSSFAPASPSLASAPPPEATVPVALTAAPETAHASSVSTVNKQIVTLNKKLAALKTHYQRGGKKSKKLKANIDTIKKQIEKLKAQLKH